MNFNDLHANSKALLICNVWDVSSAKIAEKLGFNAIGTSSDAIATMLGYNDGEDMSFDELLYIVKRIMSSTNLPLSVDLEAGYSRNPEQIIQHIHQLIELGVVGINIEDSIVENERKLVNSDDFSSLLKTLSETIKNKLFINVRTDTYLLDIPNKLEETLFRIEKYEQAGANGIFVPCITDNKAIETICKATNLPINVMCMPDLSDFKTLESLGVKRISMGNFVFNKLQQDLENQLSNIVNQQQFKGLF